VPPALAFAFPALDSYQHNARASSWATAINPMLVSRSANRNRGRPDCTVPITSPAPRIYKDPVSGSENPSYGFSLVPIAYAPSPQRCCITSASKTDLARPPNTATATVKLRPTKPLAPSITMIDALGTSSARPQITVVATQETCRSARTSERAIAATLSAGHLRVTKRHRIFAKSRAQPFEKRSSAGGQFQASSLFFDKWAHQ